MKFELAERRWIVWMAGIIVGAAATAVVYLGVAALGVYIGDKQGRLFFVVPSLFLTPLFGGFAASYIWRRLNPRLGATVQASLVLSILAVGGSAVLFKEGAICLLIVSPLFFVMILAGALIGRVIFKSDRSRLHLAIFPLLALFATAEMITREDLTGVVTDEILVNAPPGKVWPEVTSFPKIPTPPAFWLFRLGLPYPEATTSEGNFVGARRECQFSGGAIFKEIVVEIEDRRMLTFDIVELPPDPELIGHLTPRRGRFVLRDNGDGTTTLIGDTWYKLHVRPLGYFDWWTHHIFQAVHRRVMEDIRRRAEESV